MLKLTSDNAVAYLRSQGWIGSGDVGVEPLSWGVSNAVLRVSTPEKMLVLKQSRPQLRTRDAWFSDIARIYREQEVMQALQPLLPALTVPEVLFADRENYVFAMSYAPPESRVWKEMLLAGQIDVSVAERAGMILGRIHETTADKPDLVESFTDRHVFVELRIDSFYRRIQERRPEMRTRIEPIVERMMTANIALCHGDYSPKNILVHDRGFTLVDYETAHLGDPTMDIGFFLSHLLLKAVRAHVNRRAFFELTRAFWRGYASEVRFRQLDDLMRNGIEHLAVCALARIDGTSPVDYLPEEPKRNVMRVFGQQLLLERIATLDAALQALDDECRRRLD